MIGRIEPVRTEDPYDDPLDLHVYLRLVAQSWWLLAVAIGIGAVLGWFIAISTPKTYVATAMLIVRDLPGDPVNPDVVLKYQGLVDDSVTAHSVVPDLGLDKPPFRLTPAEFLAEDYGSRNSSRNLIFLDVKLADAVLAARAANALAENAVKFAFDRDQRIAANSKQSMTAQLELAERSLNAALAALVAFREKTGIDASRADATLYDNRRTNLANVALDIESARGALRTAEDQLGRTPHSIRLGSAEAVNPEFASLTGQIVSLRLRVAELEARRTSLTRMTPPATTLAGEEATLHRLESDVDAARSLRDQLMNVNQRALREQVLLQPRLQVSREAAVRERDVTSTRRAAGAGGATGLFVALLALLFKSVNKYPQARP